MEKVIDIEEIQQYLAHRYPFLLVDRVVKLELGKYIKAYKNVTTTEPYFEGHFPGKQVMPGVLILEAMAQAGAFLVLNSVDNPMKKNMFFSALSDAKFRHPIIPGDQLRLEMSIKKFKLETAL